MQRFSCLLIFIAGFFVSNGYGQARICPTNVPVQTANLSSSPTATWVGAPVQRDNVCCGVSNPDRCIEFIVTLHPNAQGIKLEIESGAEPNGSMFYQVSCGPLTPIDSPLCLNGVGPHNITFCKPGGNVNTYRITSIAKPTVSPPTVVSDGCESDIFATGYIESTITWRSVPNNPVHDAYLSATSGQDSVTVTFLPGAPAFIDYEVCGTPTGGCVGNIICNTVRVFFVNTLQADIQPKFPTICFGSVGETLTANGVGGLAPFTYLWNTGATTQSIVAATAGTYSVIIDDATSCPIAFDTVVVTAFPSTIVANAGVDRVECNNSSPFSVPLSGSVTSATGGIWSSTGTGTFSPNNTTLNASYLPSAAEILSGQVLLTLTTTGNGTCPADTDQIYIRISNAPIVDAGNPITVCANNASATLSGSVSGLTTTGIWSTSGTGNFTPNNTTLNATYNPSAADILSGNITLTLTSTNNGVCNAVVDNLSFTINPAPVVNANSNQTVCANNPNVLLNGSVSGVTTTGIWTSNGTGTFSPNNTTLNATYIPSNTDITNGAVQLILSSTNNGNCLIVRDTMNVTIGPAPIVNAGTNITRCRNNIGTITLNGSVTGGATTGTWSSTNGTGTLNPNASTLNATYTPSLADLNNGTVTLVLSSTGNSGGLCNVVRDTVILTFTPSPIVNAGNDQSACANNINFNLNGSVSAGATTGIWTSNGTGTFNPNNTTLNASYIPSNADIVGGTPIRLILSSTGNTGGTCTSVNDTLFLTISPAPIVNAGNDFAVCASNPTINLSGTVSAGASTGVWTTTNGTGTFSPNTSVLNPIYTPSVNDITNGSVTFILSSTGNTGGTCNIVRDTIIVTINPRPVVNAGVDITRCRNNIGIINISGTVSGGASTGQWSTSGTGTFVSPTSLTTSYTPSNADINSATPIQLILTSTGNSGGLCTEVKDTLLLNFTAAPIVSAGSNISVCANNIPSGVQLNGSITGGASAGIWTSNGTGTFSPNSTTLNAVYNPSAADILSGNVQLKLKSTNHGVTNCSADSSIVTITINPAPIVSAGSNQTICANATNTITLSGSVTAGASTGTWTSNGTGTFANANNLSTTYTLSAADKLLNSITFTLTSTGNSGGTCNTVTSNSTLTITPAPIVNAGVNQTVCKNNAVVTLNGSVTAGATTGTWSSPNGTGIFSNINALNSTYTPSVSDRNNGSVMIILTSTGNTGNTCVPVKDTMIITYTPEPIVNAGNNFTVCANNALINLAGVISGGASTGIWTTTNGTNAIASPTNLTTTYTPSATDILNGSVQFILSSTGNTGNTCLAVHDTIVVSFSPSPIVNAGSNISRCRNNIGTINLNGSVSAGATTGVWSTNGTGVFTPNNTTLNATYIPSNTDITNGTVQLILSSTGNTGGSCNIVRDTLILTITPSPIVNAGSNVTICANNLSPIALTGSVSGGATTGEWSTSGTGTFGNVNNLNTTYTLSNTDVSNGTVILKLKSTGNTGGSCIADSSSLTITILPAPIVNAGSNRTVCSSSPNVTLNSSIIGGASTGIWTSSGTGTFNPNNTSLNATYIPSSGDITLGTVQLILSSTGNSGNLCSIVRDTVQVTITPSALANAGLDQPICKIQPTILLNGQVSGSTTTGIWSTNGTGTFTPNANTLNATYTISPTDTLLPGLTFVLTSTNNGTCPGDNDTMLVTFSISDDASFTYSSGTYCFDDPLSFIPVIPILATGSSGIFSSTPAGLSLNTSTGAIDVSASNLGTYNIKFVTNGPCPDSSNVSITITNSPNANFTYNTPFCKGDINAFPTFALGASAGFFTSNSPDLQFINQNTGEIDIYNSLPGTYTITNTIPASGSCPSSTASSSVTINNWVRASTPDNLKTVCANNSIVSIEAVLNNGPVSTGSWKTNGDGTFGNINNLVTTYTPGNADINNGNVNVRFVSDDPAGVCTADSVTIQITITPAPVVDAGVNDTICASDGFISLSGLISGGANTGVWTSTGTGTFTPNNTTLNATYIYTNQDTTNGFVKFYLTSTGNTNNTCNAVVDSVTYHLILDPVITAGIDQSLCFNEDTVYLNGSITGTVTTGFWSSSGTGFFIPDNTAHNAKYVLTNADKISGNVLFSLNSNIATSVCAFVSDTISVTINTATIVDAGPNRVVCENNSSIALTASISGATTTGIWKTNGDGSFDLGTTTLNNIYTPGPNDRTNGSVILRLVSTNNGNCVADSDFVQILITPSPIVSAGADQNVCENNININLNGTISGGATTGIWTTSGTGAFLPNDSSLNASYIPSNADLILNNINIILSSTGNTNNTCNVVSDTLQLNFINSPTINAGPDINVCENNISTINIQGTIAGGITKAKWSSILGDGTFSPNDSSLTIDYTLGPNDITKGFVTLVLTSSDHSINSCLVVNDTMQILINPSPIVSVGADQTVCANTPVLLNGIISGGASTGIWRTDNGTGSFTNNNSLNSIYNPSVADVALGNIIIILESTGNSGGTCTPVTDTFILNFTPVPIVDAGINQTFCADVDSVQLAGSVTVTTTNGVWSSSGTGTFLPNNTDLNAYYVPSLADTTTGLVTLYLTSAGGVGTCSNTVDSIEITFTPAPIIDAGQNGIVCENNSNINLNGIISGASNTGLWKSNGTGTFFPNNTSLNTVYTPSANDILNGNVIFTLLPDNISTCKLDSDFVQYTFTPSPLVEAGNNQNLCVNENSINLNGQVSLGAITGRWTTNGSGTFTPNDSSLNAIYQLSASDRLLGSFKIYLQSTGNTNGTCLSVTDSLVVTLLPAVQITQADTITVCANNSNINLLPTVSGIPSSVLWTTTGSGTFLPNNTTLNATYIPSVNDTTNRRVVLNLIIGNLGGCLNTTDSIVLLINPAPVVIAGQNITVCANNDSVLLNGSIFSGASAGIWTSDGTGIYIPNANTLNAIYVPSNTDRTNGQVRFILNSTNHIVNSCLIVSDTLLLNIGPAPIVQAGSDVIVCANDANVILNGIISTAASTGIWTSSGTGTFSPNNTSLNATYIPSNADVLNGNVRLFLSTTDHALQLCNMVSDSLDVTINPAPIINLQDTVYACITDNAVNVVAQISLGSNTGIWTSLGSGTFSPNNTDLDINYIPSAQDKLNGQAQLVLTSTGNNGGLCIAEIDTTTIIFTPLIFINDDDTLNVCKNNNIIQLNGIISGGSTSGRWITNGSGTFTPNDTTLNAQYILSPNDTTLNNLILSLQSTNNGGCDTAEYKVYIEYIDAPFVSAGPDINICSNSGLANLTGFISGGASKGIWTTTGSGTFVPNDTTLNAVYIPSVADFNLGQLTLRLTTRDHSLQSCLTVFDEMLVSLYVSATVTAGPDRYICYPDDSISLFANANGANPFRYFWSTGDTTANIKVGPGTYRVRIQDINDCIPTYDTVEVFAVDTLIQAVAGNDSSICIRNDSIQLNGYILGFNNGHWQGNGTFFPDSTALNGIYYPTNLEKQQGFFDLILVPSNITGCTFVNDTVRYSFINIPNPTLNGPSIVCLQDSIASYGTDNVPGFQYNWSIVGGTIIGSNTSNTVNVDWTNPIGTITLVVSNVSGCDTILQQTIDNLEMPKPIINGELSVCNPSAFNQVYTVTNTPGNTYQWQISNGALISGAQTNSVTVRWNGSGQLIAVELGPLGCEVRDTIDFVYNPLLTSVISPLNQAGCSPLNVQFTSNSANPEPLIYKWIMNGDTILEKNPNYNFDTAGVYNIQYILSNGICTDTLYTSVTVHPDPVAAFEYINAPFDSLVFPNDTLYIQNLSQSNAEYYWEFGDGTTDTVTNPIHEYGRAGVYLVTLRVTDRTTGCISYISRPFTLEVNSNLNSPSIFTPNGDGVNDNFRIYERNLRNFKILIFNRWGQIVYTSNDPNFEWDGTHKGQACTPGAYVYHIVALGEDNTDFIRTDIVNLVR